MQQPGFEIMDDKRSRLIERIKSTSIYWVCYAEAESMVNLSDQIAVELHCNYNYLRAFFQRWKRSG